MPIDRAGLGTQVAELFRAQIRAGAWPLGSKIPTEPELVERSGAGHLAQLHTDLVEAIIAADPARAATTMSTLLQPLINEAG